MANLARRYATAVRDETDLFAAWPIGTTIQIGDVGFLSRRGKLFERRTNLTAFGIAIKTQQASQATDLDVRDAHKLKMQFKAAGDVPPSGSALAKADVGISIAFGWGSSVVVRAHTIESSISDLQTLEAALIQISGDRRWHPKFVVVTTTYQSTGTTVLLSRGWGSNIDIKASSTLAVPFDLADASLGLSSFAGSQKFISALAKPGFVPFFQVHHLIGVNRGQPQLWLYGKPF